MKIVIRHRLTVPLGTGSAHAVEHVLLTPFSGPSQTVKEWAIDMPGIETAAKFADAYGNKALLVGQAKPEGDLTVTVTGTVETQDRAGVLGRLPGEPVVALFRRSTPLTEPDEALLASLGEVDRHPSKRIALLHAIMGRLGEMYRFDDAVEASESAISEQSQTQGAQAQSQSAGDEAEEPEEPETRETVDAARFTHSFIATARVLDIPARYVTGYLAADEEQPAAFHAWAEAYDEGLGWIGFDAAHGVCPTDRYVRIATGLDAASAAPIRAVPSLGEPAVISVDVAAQ